MNFSNRILVLGYGSISKATLPLISNVTGASASQITVLAKDVSTTGLADNLGVNIKKVTLTKDNFKEVLKDHLTKGDLLINLTAEVSSLDLMSYCSNEEILYLDTCIELWPDEIDVNSKTYDEREQLLGLQEELKENQTTLLSSMGANPGIVSLLTKKLMTRICEEVGLKYAQPTTQADWGKLAYNLGVQVIHVNERDTQYSDVVYPDQQFVSTWSVEAMIVESIEAAEMSIGSHERELPQDAVLSGTRNKQAIHFKKSGKDVRIKTWLPIAGEQTGMILNHNEPFSIAELYTHKTATGEYSPTTCFVYHPSDQTMKSLEHLTTKNYDSLQRHLLLHDIKGGTDELGVFIMTKEHGSFWLGSRLNIHEARKMNPESSATSLQVAAGVIAGIYWIIENPNKGLIEPENIPDHETLLTIAEKYWGGYVYARTDWKPGGDPTSLQFLDFQSNV
jgi:homospermidine synthase